MDDQVKVLFNRLYIGGLSDRWLHYGELLCSEIDSRDRGQQESKSVRRLSLVYSSGNIQG
jgi:hypothetical protein